MGLFSACLSDVVPTIGLKGEARAEYTPTAGKKYRLHARSIGRLRRFHQLLNVSFVAVMASCKLTHATPPQLSNFEPHSAQSLIVDGTFQASAVGARDEEHNQDCFAIGADREREGCFARLSDAEIIRCEQTHLYACDPYKKMYYAEQKTVELEKNIELLAMQVYGHGKAGDNEYAGLSTKSLRATNRAWRSYRDSSCISEQYIAGTNRGREFGDIVEACRLEMTEARIQKLAQYLQSFQPSEIGNPAPKHELYVRYPEAIQGFWMPQSMGCIQSANGGMYEGEALITITSEMLGQYENTSRPLQVEQISEKPATWRISSAFSPGTGEYEGNKILIFTLNAGTLLIDVGGYVTAYIKCEYNKN